MISLTLKTFSLFELFLSASILNLKMLIYLNDTHSIQLSSMNQSRGIFKSMKNVPSDAEPKKVTLVIKNSHKLIDNDLSLSEHTIDPEYGQRDSRRPKTVEVKREKNQSSSSRSIKNREKTIKIKGCLKREGSQKNVPIIEDEQIKSSKSIKFNIKCNNVFEYTVTEQTPKRRETKKVKQKIEENCCNVY